MDSEALNAVKEDFDRNGFAVIRRFFSEHHFHVIANGIDHYIKTILPGLAETEAFYEDKGQRESLFRLCHMGQHDPFFKELEENVELVCLARALLDDTPCSQSIQMFGKAPRIGKATPPHQDGFYYKLTPNEALTFWLAIDPVDKENGCVHYISGSHRRGMRHHEVSDVFGFSLGINDFSDEDRKQEKSVCLQPGDMIAHHSMTIHRTDPNCSDRRRRALGLVYFAARAQRDEEAVERHQEKITDAWKDSNRL